jgi:hypothetical protein
MKVEMINLFTLLSCFQLSPHLILLVGDRCGMVRDARFREADRRSRCFLILLSASTRDRRSGIPDHIRQSPARAGCRLIEIR